MCPLQTITNGIVTDTPNSDIGECKTETRGSEGNEPIPLSLSMPKDVVEWSMQAQHYSYVT